MKKLALTIAAATMAVGTLTVPAVAEAQELREVNWYRIQMIKWKAGKGERAHQIIEMFEKVDKALGWNDVLDFHMGTGEWDSIVAIRMRNGIAAMGWKEDPDDKKWEAEFFKQVGGEEKGKALWAEFEACMEESQTQLGHIDVGA